METIEASPKERGPDYLEELPADREQVWNLLHNYSHIPEDEIEGHLRDIREKAWNVYPYGCIGRWLFLDCVITSSPEYPSILERVKSGDVLLDAGCAFGYVLRQLAHDGAPAANLMGTDIQQGFLDLGYELFKDRDTFQGTFLAGNLLDLNDQSLDSMDGKVDIIHAAALFHLFGWDDQVKLGIRLVRFFKADAKSPLIVGRQIGNMQPLDPSVHAAKELGWYRHNLETWQRLWDEVGEKTGTKWNATGVLREAPPAPGTIQRTGRAGLNFTIRRVS